jgi:deazaflavin-dependent oxidoreductase (nitroreductase family)
MGRGSCDTEERQTTRRVESQRKGRDMTSLAQQEQDANAAVIAEFRAHKGEVKAPYDDPPPMLLLHTIGRKSGKEHIVPMRGIPAGEAFYVFGSAHGKVTHPDWYYNLIAQPDITIERGTESYLVHATEVAGEERDRIFARQAARFPIFAEYERRLERTIPVIRLDPRPSQRPETGSRYATPSDLMRR